MEHEGNEYMGCLLFSDSQFCQQICELLRAHCGKSLEEIGDLEISQFN